MSASKTAGTAILQCLIIKYIEECWNGYKMSLVNTQQDSILEIKPKTLVVLRNFLQDRMFLKTLMAFKIVMVTFVGFSQVSGLINQATSQCEHNSRRIYHTENGRKCGVVLWDPKARCPHWGSYCEVITNVRFWECCETDCKAEWQERDCNRAHEVCRICHPTSTS
ncbi:uncharacterized protein MELLADRAFT_112340 [Melampsora larici-populina 98AG31]|uniref:Uncharacterized protein n=1 Tax=Melampsora larici-populina (strain 98AG31 / pathotype 3-4-7) TaxID=747676 RepID=F4S660_MELLP|nr:uncharacterized protein MELLADRAFT_112340 [Melampsora larici-populina 98AG31]EGF99879.1 hypothetical protein MELLADRAFT_112340 [Melampsora larici-populina 98AG31]